MLRTTNIHVRFAQGIAVAAAVAALLVPVASATPLITDTLAPGGGASINGHHFVTSIPVSAEAYRFAAYTDTLGRGGGVHRHHFVTSIPVSAEAYRFAAYTDTLGRGGSPVPTVGYRFITDTLAPGGGNAVVSVPASNGFNWTDAGVGALIAFALMLAAITGRQLLRRRRGQVAF
jgi:hypothetical protein